MFSSLYCMALVSLRNDPMYRSLTLDYTRMLLQKGKKVVLISPFFHEIRQELAESGVRKLDSLAGAYMEEVQDVDDSLNLVDTLALWKRIGNLVRESAKTMNTEAELVLFLPIEPLNRDKLNLALIDLLFPFKWSGLISKTRAYHQQTLKLNRDPGFGDDDYVFRSENCVGVCLLDRFAFEAVRSRVYKKVVLLPESGNYQIDSERLPISVQSMMRASEGRIRVGLVGDEAPDGLAPLLQLIQHSDSDRFFFFYSGPIPEIIPDAIPENLVFIPFNGSENEQNQLYALMDIAFQYFYSDAVSCRMLNKAAHFHKPVIANKDQLVGKYVRRFHLGLAVNGKLQERVDALRFLSINMPSSDVFDERLFDAYCEIQTHESIEMAFEQLTLF